MRVWGGGGGGGTKLRTISADREDYPPPGTRVDVDKLTPGPFPREARARLFPDAQHQNPRADDAASIRLQLATGLVALLCAVSTSSAASRAPAWSCATEVRSTMSATSCGPNGSGTLLQSM